MTGSLQKKRERYYLSINTYQNGVRKPTSIPTGLVIKGNSTRAKNVLTDVIAFFEAHPEIDFTAVKWPPLCSDNSSPNAHRETLDRIVEEMSADGSDGSSTSSANDDAVSNDAHLTAIAAKTPDAPKPLQPPREKITYPTKSLTDIERSLSGDAMYHEYLLYWLLKKKGVVEDTTWESYQSYIECHLYPYFKERRISLAELSRKHIKQYYDNKSRDGARRDGRKGGLSTESLKNHAKVLNASLKEASIMEHILFNPAQDVPIPTNRKETKRERVFLSRDEATMLLNSIEERDIFPIVFVALNYGLRKSELLGLKWSAIDFQSNTMWIKEAVVKVKTIHEKKTKNRSSTAKYALLPEVRALFLYLKSQIEENQRAFGDSYIKTDHVFVRPNGKPYRPDGVYRTFQNVLKSKNLPAMRFHDLRHSTASILHDKGWAPKDIQEWMRHSDSQSTALYTHIHESRKVILSKDMEDTFTLGQQSVIGNMLDAKE